MGSNLSTTSPKRNQVHPEMSKSKVLPDLIKRTKPWCDHVFADEKGIVIKDAYNAIYRRQGDTVMYRGALLLNMFESLQDISENGCNSKIPGLEVYCGYIPSIDAFAFLIYEKAKAKNDICPICLEDLWSSELKDITVRVQTSACYHDIHYHCHKQMEDKGLRIAPCCKQRHREINFHCKITGFIIYQYKVHKDSRYLSMHIMNTEKFFIPTFEPMIAMSMLKFRYNDIIPCGFYDKCLNPDKYDV